MLIKGTLILKDKRPFCLFKNREVGIASGYFAGNMFLTTHEDEYITQVSGESFGWFDADGEYFRDSKYDMTRPTEEEIARAVLAHPDLRERALAGGLIEIHEEEMENEGVHNVDMEINISEIFLN